jgi:ubiquinone/menaquinone biosynthesis C-methylase UbiE
VKLPFDHFDLIAGWYDWVLHAAADDRLRDALVAQPGGWLLDVGGGTGALSAPLAAAGVRVAVCDLSWGMAREAHAKGLCALLGSVERLPFADRSVERLLVVDAFHHFTRPSRAVQVQAAFELLRVLQPGGRLVIKEMDIRRPGIKAVALGEKLLLMGSRFLSPVQLVTLFEAAGARTLAQEPSGSAVIFVFTR